MTLTPTPRLTAALQAVASGLLELVFPTRCAGCGRGGEVWCADCRRRLRPAVGETCLACRRRLAPTDRHDCGPSTVRAVAAAIYRPPLDRALTRLKYRADPRLVAAMTSLLARTARAAAWAPSCVIPVPLGGERRRQRGYNQAETLGRALAAALRLPVFPAGLSRTRDTASQVGLDPAERWANVEGAFRADATLVERQRILLLDDVLTTGATLAACAAALLEAGASDVLGLTVGRAEVQHSLSRREVA